MASKAGIDYDLLLVVGLCEFYEEDFGGEIVDVCNSEGHNGIGQLMGDDLGALATRLQLGTGEICLDVQR